MTIKTTTLIALIIFLLIIIGIFIGSNLSFSNIQKTNTILLNTHFKSININKLQPKPVNSQPDSFTMTEVKKHNLKSDCYLVINNKVYAVSSYLSYHPGGSRVITSQCGTEVTGIFAQIHSNRAWDLLSKYKIGIINTNKQSFTPQLLTMILNELQKVNPNAYIIKVSPKTNYYVAKIIFNNNFYEVHIDSNGKIFKEEVAGSEADWSLWEKDIDDY